MQRKPVRNFPLSIPAKVGVGQSDPTRKHSYHSRLPQRLLLRQIFEHHSLLRIASAQRFLQVSSDASAPHLVSFNFGIRTKEGPECLWGGTRGQGGVEEEVGRSLSEA